MGIQENLAQWEATRIWRQATPNKSSRKRKIILASAVLILLLMLGGIASVFAEVSRQKGRFQK
jgi:hypothetical protein